MTTFHIHLINYYKNFHHHLLNLMVIYILQILLQCFFFQLLLLKSCSLFPKTPTKFSAGWDGIPSIVLKYLPLNALSALSFIFNQSLSQGKYKFISTFKHAKIIPIYKKGNSKNVTNYQPISLLSNIFKIIEKIVCNCLYSFLNSFNLFSNYQFGFRHGHCTSHVITLLVDKVTKSSKISNSPGHFLGSFKSLRYD